MCFVICYNQFHSSYSQLHLILAAIIHVNVDTTWVIQNFCNISEARDTIRQLPMLLARVTNQTWRWDTETAWYSTKITQWLRTWLWNSHFSDYLTFPDCRGSCNPNEILLVIWLLYCVQLHFHLLTQETCLVASATL